MITLRRMEERDAAGVARLEAANFSMPWSEKDFREMLHREYACYFVAEEGGEIVGCCGLLNMSGEGEITNMAVKKESRRKGVAAMLLDQALKEGKKLAVSAFTLEVRVSNEAAIGLYKKFGFEGMGERRDFYEKPRENALIMWKR